MWNIGWTFIGSWSLEYPRDETQVRNWNPHEVLGFPPVRMISEKSKITPKFYTVHKKQVDESPRNRQLFSAPALYLVGHLLSAWKCSSHKSQVALKHPRRPQTCPSLRSMLVVVVRITLALNSRNTAQPHLEENSCGHFFGQCLCHQQQTFT